MTNILTSPPPLSPPSNGHTPFPRNKQQPWRPARTHTDTQPESRSARRSAHRVRNEEPGPLREQKSPALRLLFTPGLSAGRSVAGGVAKRTPFQSEVLGLGCLLEPLGWGDSHVGSTPRGSDLTPCSAAWTTGLLKAPPPCQGADKVSNLWFQLFSFLPDAII